MKKYLFSFACGLLFALGAALGLSTVAGVEAALLTVPTGPAGTAPVNQPQILPDLVALYNAVNSNAAFADTNTPSNGIGINSLNTSTAGNAAGTFTGIPVLQLMSSTVFTTTTGSSNQCSITGAKGCIFILGPDGHSWYIPYTSL